MATQSRSGLQTDINTDIADNTTQDISPADVRGILTDLNDSTVNKITDTNLIGWYEFDATVNYYTNQLVIYGGNLYKFNQNHSAGTWNSAHADLYAAGGATEHFVAVSLSSAQIKALKTTPVKCIDCPVGGTIVITSASWKCGNGNTPYSAETDVHVYTNNASINQVEFTNILTQFTLAAHVRGELIYQSYASDTQFIANEHVYVTTPTADPTLGDWAATIYLWYRIII